MTQPLPAGTPSVSVVIPAHRAAAFIARSVGSVLAQHNVRVECIVVVDGLVDATLDELARFPDVAVITHEKPLGAQRSRNVGLNAASHPFVMFLDADDEIAGPLLAEAAQQLGSQEADVCFANCVVTGHRAGALHLRRTQDPLLLLEDWLRRRFVPPCAVVWRRSFLQRIGGWREDLIKNQDGELVYRALLSQPRIAFAERGFGIYHDHYDTARTSKQISAAVMANHRIVLRCLLERIRALGLQGRLEQAVGESLYSYRRRAAKYGLRSEYEILSKLQADTGFSRHLGSWPHRVVAGCLGLYTKERLKARLHAIFGRRRTAATPASGESGAYGSALLGRGGSSGNPGAAFAQIVQTRREPGADA